MKRYLFDKIKIGANGVQFIPFRKATIAESFMAFTHMSFSQDEWDFIPTSFKEFLKMLSKTKIGENSEYDINVLLQPTQEKSIAFDALLKHFASEVYADRSPDKDELGSFYQNAYQIKQEAQRDGEILNQEPGALVGE